MQDEHQGRPGHFRLGLRVDHYDGLTTQTVAQPRLGVALRDPAAATPSCVGSYGRTMETPYNENLLLHEQRRCRRVRHAGVPLPAGIRDQIEVGVSRHSADGLVVDVGYFHKHTMNAYDFDVLFDTPIFFPVSWDHSKLDGITGRVTLVEHDGFSAFMVFGHTNAMFFTPGHGRAADRVARRGVPHRPRSEVPADDQRAVRLRQARGLDGASRGATTRGWSPAP